VKIITIYNEREVWGGEDYNFEITNNILEKKGNVVHPWILRNVDHIKGMTGKIKALFRGIYSPSMYRRMLCLIEHEKPDVVHTYNLYPLFSPSVLAACRKKNIPVVVHCHSYFLTCPATFHFLNGEVCERCTLGREYWCIFKNCRKNYFESIGYALRSFVVRKFKLIIDNVTFLIVLNEFAKKRLVDIGYPEDKIMVLSNALTIPMFTARPSAGTYVAYIGRLSQEKGVDTLIAAAKLLPMVKFCIAGDGPIKNRLIDIAPDNVEFMGWINREKIQEFYKNAFAAVVPSICYEGFPMTIVDAMLYGIPVICSRIGGMPEVVNDGIVGMNFEPGNPNDLADKIKILWNDPDLSDYMGASGREKAVKEYSIDAYYNKLVDIYLKAICKSEK